MKRITVFCGSSSGTKEIYKQKAYLLGQVLAEHNIGLVYGGARIGLMGAVADGALSKGGEVIGVLPHFLRKVEIQHTGLTQLILVDSMHERKLKMNELCDGVIALPGGFGTMEELFEMLTWGQLGLHQKPIALFNEDGFYNSLISFIQETVDNGFLKEINQHMLLVSNDAHDIIRQMKNYIPPDTGKWISESTT